MKNLQSEIKKVLKKLRKSHKLTQRQLAVKFGISQQSLHCFELDNQESRNIKIFDLELYSIYFNIPVSQIVRLAERQLLPEQPLRVNSKLHRLLTEPSVVELAQVDISKQDLTTRELFDTLKQW